MEYIDDIKNNLKNVHQDEIETLYSAIFPKDEKVGVYLEGELGGRSLQALKIGTRPLSPEGILVYSTGDCSAPGKTVAGVFKAFHEKYGRDRSVYTCISGSGNSIGPYENSKNLTEEELHYNISLHLITSSPESAIGKIFKEYGGNIIQLKGRKTKAGTGKDYVRGGGLREDEFELEATQGAQIISDGIVNKIKPEEFYGYYLIRLEDLDKLKETISELKEGEAYGRLLECLADPVKNVISYGQSVSGEVAKMNNTRLGHIRPLTMHKIGLEPNQGISIGANQNYVLSESSTPNFRKNTTFLCISQSGTGMVNKHIKDARNAGAEYFAITREGNFPEERTLRLYDAQNFYPNSCILLSNILMDLGIDLVESGVEISDEVLRGFHVKDKLSE